MKKINKAILTSIVATALSFSGIFVYGQNTKPAPNPTAQEAQKAREEAQARVKQIRQELKQKIGQIKDKTKQDLGNKIMDQIDHINKAWTDHFTNVLNKLETILGKIQTRTQKAASGGANVTEVNAAISKAGVAIVTARTAVLSQSQRTYAINTSTITGETSSVSGQNGLVSTLRTRFQLLKDQVLKDLFTLRDGAMKDARNAVQDAFRALSKVPNVDKEPATN